MDDWKSTLENMVMMHTHFWQGKTVLVTGHTGFKGAWLCLWLQKLGAHVVGYALPPHTQPNLYTTIALNKKIHSIIGDICDLSYLQQVMQKYQPDIVFHLAAQALVREGYDNPVATFQINALGTAHVLEVVRHTSSVKVCQIITTDKCYENQSVKDPYCESDPLGGSDPYSSSKACAELVSATYRRSFFSDNRVSIATARAGNVIGGGDWSKDRIVPDCIRALQNQQVIILRNPQAIRPWQFVLEPLSAYLWLAQQQWNDSQQFSSAWNFGPGSNAEITVQELVRQVVQAWGDNAVQITRVVDSIKPESKILRLNVNKARDELQWCSVFDVKQAIVQTVQWYQHASSLSAQEAYDFCEQVITSYTQQAQRTNMRWATSVSGFVTEHHTTEPMRQVRSGY